MFNLTDNKRLLIKCTDTHVTGFTYWFWLINRYVPRVFTIIFSNSMFLNITGVEFFANIKDASTQLEKILIIKNVSIYYTMSQCETLYHQYKKSRVFILFLILKKKKEPRC